MSGGGAGPGAVVRHGHLRKLKTMKKKFFVLRAEAAECGARLEYYESEKKFRAGALPRRCLPLKGCYNIMRRLDLKQRHVIALFTREEQFCIVAENESELHGWLSAILTQHRSDEASEELLHPIQHVWQVNVQKKGLGATKNIHGLYNLCLTDKTLTLVKIKSLNNVIGELGIQDRVEYSLKNVRRCGDSECFFYMEVGRQTVTGAGELWMHTDDSNIAQSMHSTILHAMRHCAKESENERDHIVIPKSAEGTLSARRSTYSDGQGRAGLTNDTGLCVGSCIRQCVCGEDSAAAMAPAPPDAEYQHNTLTDKPKHSRTGSLPAGCPSFQEPLRISHKRTWSEPLTGEQVGMEKVKLEKHSSCKAVNGIEPVKKSQCARRASTGMRFKLSPAHSKNASTLNPRGRCDSMPARAVSTFEVERPPPRLNDLEVMDISRDETDAMAEWYRTPRIPEEPDIVDMSREFFNMSMRAGSSIQHSRTSSVGLEDPPDGYLGMEPGGALPAPAGYLAMAPHEPSGLLSASSGSVCSGTPSTDPRFSEYQLEPATSHIGAEARPPRAYSVGSRPAGGTAAGASGTARHRAYSVGASGRAPRPEPRPVPRAPRPPASAEDLMLLDFTTNSPQPKSVLSRTPPRSLGACARVPGDEYVDMSPRNAGYVEMRPGSPAAAPPPAAPATPSGYLEMNYSARHIDHTRPIAIAWSLPPPPLGASPLARTPLGSQTIFPLSLDSPASPPAAAPPGPPGPPAGDAPHPLTTVREISEEGAQPMKPRSSPPSAVSCSPQYVQLRPLDPELPANPTAAKALARGDDTREPLASAPVVLAGAGGGVPAPFRLPPPAAPAPAPAPAAPAPPPAAPAPPPAAPAPLHYAALDLEAARRAAPAAAPAPRVYTKIDFMRSEKIHTAGADGT